MRGDQTEMPYVVAVAEEAFLSLVVGVEPYWRLEGREVVVGVGL